MRGAPLVAIVILLAAGSASAGWLTEGHDAARTFSTPEEGPATEDVALSVPIDGEFSVGILVIRGGWVYALLREDPPVAPGVQDVPLYGPPTHHWIIRIGLDDARVEDVVDLGIGRFDWTADDDRFYLHPPDGVQAYRFADLQLDWELSWATANDPTLLTGCIQPASANGILYFSCYTSGRTSSELVSYTRSVETYAVRAADGEILWQHSELVADPFALDDVVTTPRVEPGLAGITQAADRVVYAYYYTGPDGLRAIRLRGLDVGSGELRWSHERDIEPGATTNDPSQNAPRVEPLPDTGLISSDGHLAFAKLDVVQALALENGVSQWTRDIPETSTDYASLAVDRGSLFVAAGPTLAKLSIADQGDGELWSYAISDGFEWSRYGLIATPTRLYALAVLPDPTQLLDDQRARELYAFDSATGELVWRRSVDTVDTFNPISLAGGVIAFRTTSGNITILGRTAASIQPALALSGDYPAVGDAVVVDLAGTQPGTQADDLSFRAEWGDGAVTDWSPQPRMDHNYTQAGDVTARFLVRNSAGQTASETRVIHVGGSPPVEPNFIARAFETQNQDRTFFLIGLLITGLGALLGLLLRHRRRDLLEREIRDAEADTERLRASPAECERMLEERRRRAREHFVRRRLDEAQTAVLDARIEELRRTVRLAAIDGMLGELPHNLVVALQQMLRDGRINAWERRHLVELLDRTQVLSPEQKARVRALVDKWHAHDETQPPAS